MGFLVQIAHQTVPLERHATDVASTTRVGRLLPSISIQLPTTTDNDRVDGLWHRLEVDRRRTTMCSDRYVWGQPARGRATIQACDHLLLRDAITSDLRCYSAASIIRTPAVRGNAFPTGTFVAPTGVSRSILGANGQPFRLSTTCRYPRGGLLFFHVAPISKLHTGSGPISSENITSIPNLCCPEIRSTQPNVAVSATASGGRCKINLKSERECFVRPST